MNSASMRRNMLQRTTYSARSAADLRNKIANKSSSVPDARLAIQRKITGLSQKFDARQRLRQNQRPRQTNPRFAVTGLGRSAGRLPNATQNGRKLTDHHISVTADDNILITAKGLDGTSDLSGTASPFDSDIPKIVIRNELAFAPSKPTKRPAATDIDIASDDENGIVDAPSSYPWFSPQLGQKKVPEYKPTPIAKQTAGYHQTSQVLPVARKPKVLKSSAQEQPAVPSKPSLQGTRVRITNLHRDVNEEDIVELFGEIGELKMARLLRQGVAEVIFLDYADAITSVRRYNGRTLDGQPMQVNIIPHVAPIAPKQNVTAATTTTMTTQTSATSPLEYQHQQPRVRKTARAAAPPEPRQVSQSMQTLPEKHSRATSPLRRPSPPIPQQLAIQGRSSTKATAVSRHSKNVAVKKQIATERTAQSLAAPTNNRSSRAPARQASPEENDVTPVPRQESVSPPLVHQPTSIQPGQPLKLTKSAAATAVVKPPVKQQQETSSVDISTIHRALFKTQSNTGSSAKPVNFVVKL